MIAPIEAIIAFGRRLRPRGAACTALFLAALILSGCGGFSYVGTWEGKRDFEAPPGTDASIYATLNKVELTITNDGTFTMRDMGIPKSGSVHYGSQSATLEVIRLFEEPLARQPESVRAKNKEISIAPQKDGTLLLTDPGDAEKAPLILRHVAKP